MKVYSAIAAVAKAMSHDGIGKDRKNTMQGYNFRGIDDVLNALSSALTQAGLVILPRVTARECVERTTAKGGAIFYVTVNVDFDLVAVEDGSKHTVTTYGEAMDSADKATNKAMSAAYKYLALLTFCIPTEATPDTDADFTTHEVAAKTQTKSAVASASGKKTAEEVVKGIVDGVKAGDAKGAAAYLASLQEAALKKLWDKIPENVQDELTVNWPEVAA